MITTEITNDVVLKKCAEAKKKFAKAKDKEALKRLEKIIRLAQESYNRIMTIDADTLDFIS